MPQIWLDYLLQYPHYQRAQQDLTLSQCSKAQLQHVSLLCLRVGWLMEAQTDELITQPRKLLVQLAVVRLGAVLLQSVHDGTCSLLAPWHQRLLHSS